MASPRAQYLGLSMAHPRWRCLLKSTSYLRWHCSGGSQGSRQGCTRSGVRIATAGFESPVRFSVRPLGRRLAMRPLGSRGQTHARALVSIQHVEVGSHGRIHLGLALDDDLPRVRVRFGQPRRHR